MTLHNPAPTFAAALALMFATCITRPSHAALPPGFVEHTLVDNLNQATGIAWLPDGRGIIWEKAGRVRLFENGNVQPAPLVDIRDEVGTWYDMGLVGLAIDPDFEHNGSIYLAYTVDYHHLRYFGTDLYNPNTNEYYHDTIGRVTRYTLDHAAQFRSAVPNSRFVLVGQTPSDGPVATHLGHHMDCLAFGEDGSLLVSVGDGASWDGFDTGGPMPNSSYTAYADGILRPQEDVGVFRAQMINSLSGKVLRLDPKSGEGLPGNPWFDPQNPRSPASRVWALGFRNPFRFCVRPDSSHHQPDGANPGVLYLGDVMEGAFDEMNVVTHAGQNFGWPLFEGLTPKASYSAVLTPNRDTPNPADTCGIPFFRFQNLLVQETLATPQWWNPCPPPQPISELTPTFMHTRPVFDWYDDGYSRTGVFNGPNAAESRLGTPGCPVSGGPLAGGCPVGGVGYTGTNFPPEYRNTYFHGDFVGRWIHQFIFDHDDHPQEIRFFQPDAGRVVCITQHPKDGALYYISYNYQGFSQLRRISYAGTQPPKAAFSLSTQFGPGPLSVQFDASASFDPEQQPLEYLWEFGDGSTSTLPAPTHLYLVEPNDGPRRFDVRLTVTDPSGLTDSADSFVTVNNTPPKIEILSPVDGSFYPSHEPSTV